MSDVATAPTAAPAAAPPSGGTILTSGLPPAAATANGSAPAVPAAADGPPEWLPAKYWDGEKKAPRIEDLGKGYQNLEKLLGSEKVPVPTSDEDAEGWDRWFKATGRPDKADDYELERATEYPSDLPYDEEMEKGFRAWAHANGLNKKQAGALYGGYVKTQIERYAAHSTAQKQKLAEVQHALQREHGGQYEGFLGQAKTALQQYADPDFKAMLDETGLGNDPRMIRVFGKIGKELGVGGDKLKGAPPQAASGTDMKTAIADFRNQHNKALMDKDHPDHGRRVNEMKALYERAYAE